MEIFIALAFLGLILAVAMAIDRVHQSGVRTNWAIFASTYKLSFNDSGSKPAISGVFMGEEIEIHKLVRSDGESDSSYTVFSAVIRGHVPAGLNIYTESLGSMMGKLVGLSDIQTGNAPLDKLFVIQSNDVPAARKLLGHTDVAERLIALGATERGTRIKDGRVVLEIRGVADDVQRLLHCVSAVASLAHHCGDALGAPPRSQPMLRQSPIPGPGHNHTIGHRKSTPSVPRHTDEPPVPQRHDEFGNWAASAPQKAGETAPANAWFDQQGMADMLVQLSSSALKGEKRSQWMIELVGKTCRFNAICVRVDWTADNSLSDDFRGGRTMICKLEDSELAVRFSARQNAKIDAVTRGKNIDIRGTIAGWDDFFRLLQVNAD